MWSESIATFDPYNNIYPTLPCKPGDKVYRLVSWGKGKRKRCEIRERIVSSVEYNGAGEWIIHSTGEDILGKNVFIDREEAEAALRGGGTRCAT